MKQVLNFGKIAYNGKRKINLVTVEVEFEKETHQNKRDTDLNPVENYYTFSVCGEIWNSKHTDCLSCGQNLDTIYRYLRHNKRFNQIFHLWQEWHLNDMKSRTEKQKSALNESGIEFKDYEEQCQYLKSIDLYTDRGYSYGHAWLIKIIPDSVIEEIKELLK